MQSMQEEAAGRLITYALRILSGHLSLETARRFRTFNSSHVYEKLAESDRDTVDKAAKIIHERYGSQNPEGDCAGALRGASSDTF
ncbi:MAG: hypothetical protein P1P90_01420 [Patescibacteria group bacterium]|nr:hypothetical protein [Patescibacteria group bacterium]